MRVCHYSSDYVDERHIRRGGIVLLFNRGKFYGFSNFCIFFLEFSEKNRKFAIRYQLSQYFAMGKYINPFTDWGFKRLFGQEFSKDLLISFLNDLLVDEMHIRDVTFKDKEQLADSKDLRGCIFDIYCETDDGNHFIVEMQNRWVPFFVNRSIYYASKAICRAAEKDNRAETCSLSVNARLCRLPHEFHAKGQCSVEIQNRCSLV